MYARLLVFLLIFGLFGDTGAEQGRQGNVLFEQGKYAEAASAYRDGLAALDDTTGSVYSGLQNNLGAALHRQKHFEEARRAFERSRRTATNTEGRVRALFNAANAAAGTGDVRAALLGYKRALLLDPTYDLARHNYEYLKRKVAERQKQREASSLDVEPSPYARRLKQKAEALVSDEQYDAAAALMSEGLQQDSTVRAYRDFMRRLDDVTRINRTAP